MIRVIGQVQVEDYGTFYERFSTIGFELRKGHGATRAQVMQSAEDPNRLTLVFDWSSREAFEGFRADPKVQESMKLSGAIGRPEFSFHELAADLPA